MNKLIISGHLGGDPKLEYIADGTAVAKFSVAVNKFKKAGAEDVPPMWIGCTAWAKQAEVISQYFKKGDKILTIGELDVYVSPNDGKTYLQQTVREFEFMNGKKLEEGNRQEAAGNSKEPPLPSKEEVTGQGVVNVEKDDDMPF